MPQDGEGLQSRTDSPTVQPEQPPVEAPPTQPVDTGAAQDRKDAPETSHPSEGEPSVGDRPRDDAGRFAAKDSKPAAPDRVKDAIDRLARKDVPKPDAPKPPGTGAADPPKDASKATEAKPTDEALKTRTKDDLDAPPEEKAKWRPDTRERFDRLFETLSRERDERKVERPLVEAGKSYSKILDDFDLHQDVGFVPPEHFAGVVKAQAAINRALLAIDQKRQPAQADIEAFTALSSNIDRIRGLIGLPSPVSQPAAIAPFQGELPQDLKDMVEVYGIDEKRVRLLAAIEAGAKAPAQPAQQPASPAQAHQPAPAQPQRPVGVDMDQLYGRKLLTELRTSGVRNPDEQVRVLLKHPQTRQEVINRFPGVQPADVPQVFDSLDASTRYEILMAAHKALTVPQVPPRPPTLPPPTTNRGVPTTATPRRVATGANGDPVAAAIAHLARE